MLDAGQIHELGAGEVISEEGFYSLPLVRHHGQPCAGASVTSSVLRTMELASPADVWAFHQLNPDRYERAASPALRRGAAMAAFIEAGPEGLERVVRVLPKDKPRRPTEAQLRNYALGRASDAARASVEYWRDVDADPRDPISEEVFDQLYEAGKVLARDPAARVALGGVPEISAAFWCEESRLWVLSRPDVMSFDGSVIDYKQWAPQGSFFDARFVDRRITGGFYHMQLALAAEAYERLTGDWPHTVGFVVQMPTPPYHVVLRAVDEDDLRLGMLQNRRARLRFRECLDSGHWPGPGEHVGAYQMPGWLHERLNEEFTA